MEKIIICYKNREGKREWREFGSKNDFIVKMYNLDFDIDYVFVNDEKIEANTIQILLSELMKKEINKIREVVEVYENATVKYSNCTHLEYLIKNIVDAEIDFSIESESEIEFYLRD